MIASFIIPVFNTEHEYLAECFDSLVKLTSVDVEFIVIDDGSASDTANLCDEYAMKDFRFKVIHKKNEGVSAARNEGVRTAIGKYITFVDSDDWIEHAAVDETLCSLRNLDFDVFICSQYIDFKKKKPIKVSAFNETRELGIEDKDDVLPMVFVRGYKTLKTDMGAGTFCNVAGKFIKRKIATEFSLLFDSSLRFSEDALFFFEFFSKCNNYMYLDNYVYHYRMRKSSATHSPKEATFDSVEKFFRAALIPISKCDNSAYLKKALCYRCYDLVFSEFNSRFFLSDDVFFDKVKIFSRELKKTCFKIIIRNISFENISGIKDTVKLFLLKIRANKTLFLLLYLWNAAKRLLKKSVF